MAGILELIFRRKYSWHIMQASPTTFFSLSKLKNSVAKMWNLFFTRY